MVNDSDMLGKHLLLPGIVLTIWHIPSPIPTMTMEGKDTSISQFEMKAKRG